MSNRLIVHIGTPKTGTTALQKFLAENREQLKKRGWCYPDLRKDWATVNGLEEKSVIYKNANLIKFSVTKGWPTWEKEILWKIIKDYLKNYDVILSDEGLWSFFEPTMEEIKAHYDNVKIVCYLRRQDLFLESKWNQAVKENLLDNNVDFLYDLKKEEVEYKKRLDWLAKIFGKENVIVRVYEKGQFGGVRGDITSDFLEACGIESDWKDAVLPGSVNERITNDVLGMKYLFNKEYLKLTEKNVFESCGTIIRKHFLSADISGENKKQGHLTLEERQKLLENFETENEYIAKEYLGRKDGKLFCDTDINIPLYIPSFSEREEQIINFFTGIIVEQEKKQQDYGKNKSNNQVGSKIPEGMKIMIRKIKMSYYYRKLNFK